MDWFSWTRLQFLNIVNQSNANDRIERLFVRNKDTFFLCGDFNIDLFKCDSHSDTKQFIDLVCSLDLYL